SLATVPEPAMRLDVVLHQRGEQRLRHAKTDRAGGEVDVVGVLGARRIGLRALVAPRKFSSLSRVWRPNRYWMAWNTGLACGFTATRSSGRSTWKYSADMMVASEAEEA